MDSRLSQLAFIGTLRAAGWELPDRPEVVVGLVQWSVFHARIGGQAVDVLMLVGMDETTWLGNVVRVQIRSAGNRAPRWGWWHDTVVVGQNELGRDWQVYVDERLASVLVSLSREALDEPDIPFGRLMAQCVQIALGVASELLGGGELNDKRMEPGRGVVLAARQAREDLPAEVELRAQNSRLASWRDRWLWFNAGVLLFVLAATVHQAASEVYVFLLVLWDVRVWVVFGALVSWFVFEAAWLRRRGSQTLARVFELGTLLVILTIELVCAWPWSVLYIVLQVILAVILLLVGNDHRHHSRGHRVVDLDRLRSALEKLGWTQLVSHQELAVPAGSWSDRLSYQMRSEGYNVFIIGKQVLLEHGPSHLRVVLTRCVSSLYVDRQPDRTNDPRLLFTAWTRGKFEPRLGYRDVPSEWLDLSVMSTTDEPLEMPPGWQHRAQRCDGRIGLAMRAKDMDDLSGVLDGLAYLVRRRSRGRGAGGPYRM